MVSLPGVTGVTTISDRAHWNFTHSRTLLDTLEIYSTLQHEGKHVEKLLVSLLGMLQPHRRLVFHTQTVTLLLYFLLHVLRNGMPMQPIFRFKMALNLVCVKLFVSVSNYLHVG